MKHIYKYILIAAGVLSLTSCADFLQPKTEGSYSVDTYFTSDRQAIDAVDACYLYFLEEDWLGRSIMWEEVAANDLVWGRTTSFSPLATLSLSSSNDMLNVMLRDIYRCIMRSNWVVSSLLDKQKSQELTAIETRSLGEAYFCRALAHFYVAYRYGTGEQGVPFCRYEDYEEGYKNEIPPQQPSVTDNYRMIIEDFTSAAALLPRTEEYADEDFGRAHKAACYGFMAKAYTYWACWDKSQYANVITCVNKMEQEYGRSLDGVEFTDNFTSDYSKWRNSEYVWTIPSEGGPRGTYGGVEFPGVSLENGLYGWFNSWGQFKPTVDVYEEFCKDNEKLVDPDKGNVRLLNSLVEYGQVIPIWGEPDFRFYAVKDLEAGFMIRKFIEPFTHANGYYESTKEVDEDGNPLRLTGDAIYTNDRVWVVPTGQDPVTLGYVGDNGNWPVCRMNFPILRFADCLLLRAEAYIATGNGAAAAKDINTVRARSNVKPLAASTATWTDLYHERRVELAFEESGHMFDCKRWAVGGDPEIKALALAELTTHPRVRHYTDRAKAGEYVDGQFIVNTDFEIAPYDDCVSPAKVWEDYKIAFPYPDEEISKANGALKQNKGYNTSK